MSRNPKATKRQGKITVKANKKQKFSHSDNEEVQAIIYPKTFTTRSVLEKFEKRFIQENTKTEVSTADQCCPDDFQSPSIQTRRVQKKHLKNNKLSKSKTGINISTIEKYSPKNIKSPSTCKSESLKSMDDLNKRKSNFQHAPTPGCSNEFAAAENTNFLLNPEISTETLGCLVGLKQDMPTHACSNTGSFDEISSRLIPGISSAIKLGPTGFEKQYSKLLSESFSGHSGEPLRKIRDGMEIKKSSKEEEIILFFQKLLPYTLALSEEKQHEFKATVVKSLQKLIGGELQDSS